MAAVLRIELRLAESKSAVLTVIRYRYVYGTGTRIRTKINGFGDRGLAIRRYPHMAEEVGFEPTGLITPGCFQDNYLRPLGHPSVWLRGIESNYRNWGMSPVSYL